MAKQVRISDDVAAELARRAGEDGSVSSEADRVLRSALGLTRTRTAGRPSSASVATARGSTSPGQCLHPPIRRIGDSCAACGQRVKTAARR